MAMSFCLWIAGFMLILDFRLMAGAFLMLAAISKWLND